MKHPPHDPDRCCRVCHAEAVTAGDLAAVAEAPPGAGLLEPGGPDDPPDRGGYGQRSLAEHYQYDRARTRKGAGLLQLHESTGERD